MDKFHLRKDPSVDLFLQAEGELLKEKGIPLPILDRMTITYYRGIDRAFSWGVGDIRAILEALTPYFLVLLAELKPHVRDVLFETFRNRKIPKDKSIRKEFREIGDQLVVSGFFSRMENEEGTRTSFAFDPKAEIFKTREPQGFRSRIQRHELTAVETITKKAVNFFPLWMTLRYEYPLFEAVLSRPEDVLAAMEKGRDAAGDFGLPERIDMPSELARGVLRTTGSRIAKVLAKKAP